MRHLTQHQISAAIDAALVGVSLQLVERHLEACEPCRMRSVRLNRTHDALRVLFRFEGGPALADEPVAPAPVIAAAPVAVEPPAPRLVLVPTLPEPEPAVIVAPAPIAPVPVAPAPIAGKPPRLATASEAESPVPDEDDPLDDLDEMDAEAAEDAFAPIDLGSPLSPSEPVQPEPKATPVGITAGPTPARVLRTAVVKPVEARSQAADPPEPRPVVLKVGAGSRRRRSRKRQATARRDASPPAPAQEPVAVPVPAAVGAPDPPAPSAVPDPPAHSSVPVPIPQIPVVEATVVERTAAPRRDAARRSRDLAPQIVSAALGVLLVSTVAGLIVLLGRAQRTGGIPPVEVRQAGGPVVESRSAPADVPGSNAVTSAPVTVETPMPSPAGPAAAPADSAPPAAPSAPPRTAAVVTERPAEPAPVRADPRPATTAPAIRKPPAKAPAPSRAAMGLLCGEVTDEEGVPVAGARILLADMEVGIVTDRRGRFCVSAPRGDRTVSVVALGFATYRLLVTMEGQTASLSIRLRSNSLPSVPGPR